MSTSTASVSADRTSPRELVVSVNWIGDAVMAMPALQHYRRLHPGRFIAVLARGPLADLWKLHAVPDEVIRYDGRPSVFDPLYTQLREHRFDTAWVLPNSFRSALIPFRSGIPSRKGPPGKLRSLLLTDVVDCTPGPDARHQGWEAMRLMNPSAPLRELPLPELRVPAGAAADVMARFELENSCVAGLIPGAARGPSKRWPEAHYRELARRLVNEGCRVVLMGGPDDRDLCHRIEQDVGGVISLAGRTSLLEWAAVMSACRLVVANDSGGMHLAAALKVPVIALYGITDPERTGPVGRNCIILQKSKTRSRDIPRNSAEAVEALASIRPGEVFEAARPLMRDKERTPVRDD